MTFQGGGVIFVWWRLALSFLGKLEEIGKNMKVNSIPRLLRQFQLRHFLTIPTRVGAFAKTCRPRKGKFQKQCYVMEFKSELSFVACFPDCPQYKNIKTEFIKIVFKWTRAYPTINVFKNLHFVSMCEWNIAERSLDELCKKRCPVRELLIKGSRLERLNWNFCKKQFDTYNY